MIKPNPQWEIDFERDEKRRSKRRFAFRVLWTAIGIAVVALAVLYYRHATDPLVAGIPPKENSDGTIDYTLIGIETAKTGSSKSELLEWVIRLPKNYIARDISEVDGSEIWFDGGHLKFNGRHNDRLQLWLKVHDLSGAASREEDKTRPFLKDRNDLILILNANEAVSTDGTAKLLPLSCQSKGSSNGLEQFVPMQIKLDLSCQFHEVGYVVWKDSTKREIAAYFDCHHYQNQPDGLGECQFRILHNRKNIGGFIGLEHLNDFPNLVKRFAEFFDTITVSDSFYKTR